jgi:hypothetical protein
MFRERVAQEIQFIWEKGVLRLPGSMNNKRELFAVSAWTVRHVNPHLIVYSSQADIVARTVTKGGHTQ